MPENSTVRTDAVLAPVHYLPTSPAEQDEARSDQHEHREDGPALDGELISEAEYQRLTSQKELALDRYRGYRRDLVRTTRAAKTAGVWTRQHAGPPAAAATRFAARHTYYATAGAWDMVCDSYKHVSGRTIDEEVAAARLAGDHGTVANLLAKKQEQNRLRLEYLQVLGKGVLYTPVVVGGGLAATLATTLIVSIAAYCRPGGMGFTDVWVGLADAVLAGWDWLSWAGGLVPWAVAVALAGIAVTGYNRRRTRGDAPGPIAPQRTDVPADEVQVTADRLITALRHCGIPELKKAIAEGETAGMVDLISQFGPGVRTTITLPRGIPAAKLAEKADSLASSLSRGEHEVMVSCSPNNNSQAELWVARPGALDEPVPTSSMMNPDYGQVDLYRDPVPWGFSLQGEPIELELIQRHILIAGLSKQGKTASARALALHAALDPSAELRIADLKGVGDWSMFDGIATTLIEGAGEDNELATAQMVEDAVVEMDRRMAARRAKGAKGDITSKEAKDGSGDNHPLIVIVDEVQIAYMSTATEPVFDEEGNEREGKRPVGGQKNNSRLWIAAKKLHDQGRAVNIHLWQFAQNPTDRNLPAIVREGAHVRGSLYVSNPAIARKALGDAPVDAGAAPDRLRSEIDAGTVVVAGAPEIVKTKGEMANTVRTCFIDTAPAYTVAERAKAIRAEAGKAVATGDGDVDEQRDVLADVVKVLKGEDWITAKQCQVRLAELAPRYYRDWTGKGLHQHLKDQFDVDPGSKDGTPVVRGKRIQTALSERADDE